MEEEVVAVDLEAVLVAAAAAEEVGVVAQRPQRVRERRRRGVVTGDEEHREVEDCQWRQSSRETRASAAAGASRPCRPP